MTKELKINNISAAAVLIRSALFIKNNISTAAVLIGSALFIKITFQLPLC